MVQLLTSVWVQRCWSQGCCGAVHSVWYWITWPERGKERERKERERERRERERKEREREREREKQWLILCNERYDFYDFTDVQFAHWLKGTCSETSLTWAWKVCRQMENCSLLAGRKETQISHLSLIINSHNIHHGWSQELVWDRERLLQTRDHLARERKLHKKHTHCHDIIGNNNVN